MLPIDFNFIGFIRNLLELVIVNDIAYNDLILVANQLYVYLRSTFF